MCSTYALPGSDIAYPGARPGHTRESRTPGRNGQEEMEHFAFLDVANFFTYLILLTDFVRLNKILNTEACGLIKKKTGPNSHVNDI